ncbi:hypothetical protein BGY98DRAFT_933169 [Russula aff. rugulosa BPL654]|nr:hypothetical protein BGY98DRAFT_933169 [Russula aff. rugulosa BPL654]
MFNHCLGLASATRFWTCIHYNKREKQWADQITSTSCFVDVARDCGSNDRVGQGNPKLYHSASESKSRLHAASTGSAFHYCKVVQNSNRQRRRPTAHFIGDVGQPLDWRQRNLEETVFRLSALALPQTFILSEVGTANTGILTKNTNALYGGSSQIYASALAARITAALTETAVPLQWTQESIAYDYTVVLTLRRVRTCAPEYYNDAVPVVRPIVIVHLGDKAPNFTCLVDRPASRKTIFG